jgi:hypothetical protein
VVLTSIGYVPGNVAINWKNTYNNHTYQVWTANSLSGPWFLLGSITATNATASYVDSSVPTVARFYRVVSH